MLPKQGRPLRRRRVDRRPRINTDLARSKPAPSEHGGRLPRLCRLHASTSPNADSPSQRPGPRRSRCDDSRRPPAPGHPVEVVTCRLAAHYLDELDTWLDRTRSALRPNGHLLMTMIHPVISCHDTPSDRLRQSWVVDDYFPPAHAGAGGAPPPGITAPSSSTAGSWSAPASPCAPSASALPGPPTSATPPASSSVAAESHSSFC